MFAAFTLSAAGVAMANKHTAFRHMFRAPQKAGISLMAPIGVYSITCESWPPPLPRVDFAGAASDLIHSPAASNEMDRCRFAYQRYNVLPPKPSKLAYWSTHFGLYVNPIDI